MIFFRNAVAVELDVEVFAELFMPPLESFLRLFLADMQNEVWNLA